MVRHRDEYRDRDAARRIAVAIGHTITRPWTIMEVCGGQTNAIVRYGLDQLLPRSVELVHGPGCPVCVTPIELIDKAVTIALRRGVIFCSFGDMVRVPGTSGDLLAAKARGADVRIVYSPMDALALARALPDREVVFFAVGFETTAPANAMAAHQALVSGTENFSLLVSHVLVPPALEAILAAPDNRVQGFLAAGHVCTVMGYEEYEPLAERHRVPIVVTGFEPLDILQGVLMCVRQLEEGRAEVENQYQRAVRRSGNRAACERIREVFEIVPRKWRGIGELARSGFALRGPYRKLDAERRFAVTAMATEEPTECRSGLVLRGRIKPDECPAFGTRCTPETPLGAPMVSAEGACAAYHRYRGRSARLPADAKQA
jgi:hydrogenase expression/formation protein HypD